LKPFRQCKYSAFVSYAHADDIGHGGWISACAGEIERALRNRIGRSIGVPVPGMHLSGKNGPVAGRLSTELRARIAESYAMIIVVHDNYLLSDWCLEELSYFKSLFGDEGFLQRLYVVAMSEPAINALTGKDSWKDLLPFDDQVWMPYYREEHTDLPLRMRLDNGQFSQLFEDRFERLMRDLMTKVKADSLNPPARPVLPPLPPPSPPEEALLFGVASAELADRVQSLADGLAAAGVPTSVLAPEALNGELPEFDHAGHLVLAFSNAGQPVKPFRFSPGGHLAAQRDAWLGKGRPAERLVWLDLRELAVNTPPGPGHAALVDAVAAGALTPTALQTRFLPKAPPPPPPPLPASPGERINIYIESNQNEVDLWDPLGEQIKRKWALLVQQYGSALVPPLFLHTRALPVNTIDGVALLNDADGVVLLWGQKTDDSLRATINKVESKLPGDIPPGIVAYLMPPRADPNARIEGNYWKVLRFSDANSDNIDIHKDEADLLQAFLRKVLLFSARKRRLTVPAMTLT
jgi:TIR domain